MSHFAEIIDYIVQRVIVIEQDMIETGLWGNPENWIQCSYNTRGGIHYTPNSNEPDNGIPLRKNFPNTSWSYDVVRDAFIPPKPYNSWVLNEDTCLWKSPIPIPNTTNTGFVWNESLQQWVEHELIQ